MGRGEGEGEGEGGGGVARIVESRQMAAYLSSGFYNYVELTSARARLRLIK